MGTEGSTALPPISMSAPDIDETDVAAVVEVLRSGRLALGPQAEEFERRIAAYAGVPHAVAVSSGTAALHLILQGLGIGPGDEVLVPSFTFAASVNAILFAGAKPVFVDIEPVHYTLDPEDAARRVTGRTRAILAVDVFGHPVEWDPLTALAERHGLLLIDDSCEALGAEYRGRRIGGFGDAAAFAFYPNKQMTTGEGGMIVTRDARLAGLAKSLRNQGRAEGSAWLEHRVLGYNYRMDELSAALGISQLKRIEDFLARRARVAARYTERLRAYDWLEIPVIGAHVRMSWFVYVVRLAADLDRDRIARSMETLGIPARPYFPPVHLEPYVRERLGTSAGLLPATEGLARRTLALPFHNRLSEADIDRVVEGLKRVVG